MGIEKKETKLNEAQTLRLINVANIQEKVVEASMVEIGCVKKFEVKGEQYDSDIFLHEDDINLIMNGVELGRE